MEGGLRSLKSEESTSVSKIRGRESEGTERVQEGILRVLHL